MQSRSIRRSGQPISASASIECGLMTGTRSAEGIMASGHANRANRPNTWLHRPATQREVLTCQPGAVHTWHLADSLNGLVSRPLLGVSRHFPAAFWVRGRNVAMFGLRRYTDLLSPLAG